MKSIRLGLAGLTLTLAGAAATGGQVAADPAMPVVRIDGVSDPDRQSYRRMVKGMDAFDKYRALAPDAQLRYRLVPRLAGVQAAGTTVQIQGDKTTIAVPLAEDLTFTLPRDAVAWDERADVVTNRAARSFAWAPDVRSPGVPPNARRLGDLRLECEIDRAATLLVGYKPPLYHVIDAAVDVCTTYPGNWLFYGDRALFDVTLVHGQRRQALLSRFLYANMLPKIFHRFYDFHPLLVDRTYTIHIADTSWPDDTIVELEYMDDAGPAVVAAGMTGVAQ